MPAWSVSGNACLNSFGWVLLLGVFFVVACQPNCHQIELIEPENSDYILPYPPGSIHELSQGYCNPWGGHRNRLAYDFAMPMGAPIVSARAGVVTNVVSHFRDGDLRRGHNNRVLIRHSDGTVAWYAHLQHDSMVVKVGDTVGQGQLLAACGNTGNTGNLPHLHFEVFQNIPYDYDDAIPVTFRNAAGPRDDRGALLAKTSYEAAPIVETSK